MFHIEIITTTHKKADVLYQKAKDVDTRDLTPIQDLITSMKETMIENEGVGLAAPQVGESIRLFLMLKGNRIQACVNPEIIKKSHKTIDWKEGCLSLPDEHRPCTRSRRITVRYYDQMGRMKKETLVDLPALIFQHEYDHLNGILISSKQLHTKNA